MPKTTELPVAATRQYIDAVQAFEAWEEAEAASEQVRGGMYWHKGPPDAPEAAYLVRTNATGGERSLGRRSPETEQIHATFTERKRASEERLTSLREALDMHRRLNRAHRVGRVDPIVVRLLARLQATKLSEHFRVVGTHALYAYEAAAGVRFDAGELATQDIDLLWDVQNRVRFATRLAKVDRSMLGVLKKVDPTFRIRDSQKYTAVNKNGFMVDILRRQWVEGDPHPIKLSDADDDFWVVQAPNASMLMSAPPFSAVIVATTGEMARMNTLDPLIFAQFKEWMSALPDREGLKRRRDAAQARSVREVVAEYLPQVQAASAHRTDPG